MFTALLLTVLQMQTSSYGGYATEDEDKTTIKTVFENEHYVLDTHTAVAAVYNKYVAETGR